MVKIYFDKFNGHAYFPSTISFFHKTHSNALPFEHALLESNEKLRTKKLFYEQTFITMDDMIQPWKLTQLVPLIQWNGPLEFEFVESID